MWDGLATGRHALRFAPPYDEQSFARRYDGCGYARADGGVDDGDDAVKAFAAVANSSAYSA